MLEERKKIAGGSVASVPAPAERRRHPRYPWTAAAEIVDTQSGARINGRTSDISKGGCYVDALNPFPVGTMVKIHVAKESHSFVAQAKVAYAMAGFGMGLMFTSMEPEQLWVLERWIAELGGTSSSEPVARQQENHGGAGQSSKGEQYYVLNELIIALMRKGVLTDAEGKAMLEKLLR